MQSSTHLRDNSNIPLGERRGISDLARFSLDLSWARAVSECARARAYPSPPMSGSPPIPPRQNSGSHERVHGSYGSVRQEELRGTQAPYSEPSRGPPLRGYGSELLPSGLAAGPYTSYRPEDMASVQLQYQPQPPHIASNEQHRTYQQLPPAPHPAPDRQPMRDAPEFVSPKGPRKTKGHVASACVPCKRAHLRCDAQRPCSRCRSNGKEDACIDVQHKKRGRPRLRDERELRGEGAVSTFHPPEPSMRRPVSMFNPGEVATPFGDSMQRGPYRVLKSHSGPSSSRASAHIIGHEASILAASMPPTPRTNPAQEIACAYMTMEMQIVKVTHSFGETIGLQHVAARNLQDIVVVSDREKVMRLQRTFDEERHQREPNLLPPIYPKHEEDRIIQSTGFSPEEIAQLWTNRQEIFSFQGPDGEHRTFHVRLGLSKRESTYFIALILHMPSPTQSFQPPSSSPYSRDSREPQYSFSNPQAYSAKPGSSSFITPPAYGERRPETRSYRPVGGPAQMGMSLPPSSMPPSFGPAPPRRDYPPNPYQTPHGEASSQPPAQPSRPHDLQLPPIRDQPLAPRRDDRSGRVDIGGLLADPDQPPRRGS